MNAGEYLNYSEAEIADVKEDRNRWRVLALVEMPVIVFLAVALFGGCVQ